MNIKSIILDVDGTLYDLDDVMSMNYRIQRDFLHQKFEMDYGEIDEYFKKNSIFENRKKDSKSCTELFMKMGIDKGEWNHFREINFDVNQINIDNAVKLSTIHRIALQIDYLILLSSNSINNIINILKRLQMDIDLFTKIICSDKYVYENTFSKCEAMKWVMQYYNIPASNVLSVGDRYKTDIEPMVLLGGNGYLVKKPIDLEYLADWIETGAPFPNIDDRIIISQI
ncbi:hypothetical protein [uncultured Acetatifactor sp.]|uniref:hypothetical protein n=1 Tax=uncultured Acetatifactor sp. TaxID=1671927 RepID=UPI00272DB387|nr:hypothetical protein [uncultured Acetatifactor sp.]